MFDVLFKAQKLLGSVLVNSELQLYYEQIIKVFVLSELNFLNLEKLSAIIIPNDFVTEVLEFQKEKGILNPNVTNTKFARALGKMIYVHNEDTYYVFVDVDKAVFIVDDQMFDRFFSASGTEYYEKCIIERKQAFNLLAHELSHVELESNILINTSTDTLRDTVILMWKHIFEEYYACRRASKICGDCSIIVHNEEYLNNIENEILQQRKNYNYGDVTLNDFCQMFHKYTRMCLIHVVSELDSVKETGGSIIYDNLKIGKYVHTLEKEFDKMYKIVCNENILQISESLINLTFEYFAEFRIFITETESGTRYDIPI